MVVVVVLHAAHVCVPLMLIRCVSPPALCRPVSPSCVTRCPCAPFPLGVRQLLRTEAARRIDCDGELAESLLTSFLLQDAPCFVTVVRATFFCMPWRARRLLRVVAPPACGGRVCQVDGKPLVFAPTAVLALRFVLACLLHAVVVLGSVPCSQHDWLLLL